jgi:hypothetical protein
MWRQIHRATETIDSATIKDHGKNSAFRPRPFRACIA